MRPVVSLGLFLFFCFGALAQQQHPGPAPAGRSFPPRYVIVPANPVRTYGSPSGFGSVLFPGLGTPPPATNAFSVGIFGGGRFRGGRRGGGVVAYPMPYPVLVGGGYYGDPSYAYPPPQAPAQPNITIVMPPAQVNPPVIINQYGPEGARQAGGAEPPSGDAQMYQQPSGPQPDDRVMFFIALKDSSVYTAVAYWVEDGTLHYITPEGRHNQVSIDLVDRHTSATLNDGRKVEFRLPAEK